MTKKKNPFKENKYEIKYNLINSFIAGLLVFFGSFVGADFSFSLQSFYLAVIVSLITMLTKFRDYWSDEKNEYSKDKRLPNFI